METGKILLLIIDIEEILLILKKFFRKQMICENIKAIKIGTGSRNLGKTNNHERNRKCYQSSFKRLQGPPPKKKASGPHS